VAGFFTLEPVRGRCPWGDMGIKHGFPARGVCARSRHSSLSSPHPKDPSLLKIMRISWAGSVVVFFFPYGAQELPSALQQIPSRAFVAGFSLSDATGIGFHGQPVFPAMGDGKCLGELFYGAGGGIHFAIITLRAPLLIFFLPSNEMDGFLHVLHF